VPDQLYLLSAALSTLADTAYAAVVGLLLARWWLNKATSPEPASSATGILTRRGPILALILYTCAHLCRPWFLAAGMSGSSAFHDNLILIPDILTGTHQGRLWFLDTAGLLLVPCVLVLPRRRWFLAASASTAGILLIAFAKAASSHAGGEGDYTLTALAQTLHILATAVWAGGILISGFLVLPRLARATSPKAIWQYGSHLSRAATIAIVLVALSGLITGYREINLPPSGLWTGIQTSPWGKILLAKIVCVLIALALGASSRFLCLGRECSHPRRRLLSRLLFAEAIVMIAILCLSGLLGNISPPMPAM